MAAVCDVCGKGPGFGKSVSHSHVRTNRRWNPNIQRVRALVDGTPKRLNVCTKCLKSDRVGRAAGSRLRSAELALRVRPFSLFSLRYPAFGPSHHRINLSNPIL